MAGTAEGTALTETQRRAQVAVARSLIASLRNTWFLLDPTRLDATTSTWMMFAVEELRLKHSESARLALTYLQDFRLAEVGRGLASLNSIEVDFGLKRAQAALYFTGPVKIKQGMTAGLTLTQASSAAFKEMARTSQMLVLNGGRGTIEAGIRRDRRAIGYQRATDGNPCHFCAMLASRGPVYRKDSFSSAKVHIGCGCTLEPVYSRSDEVWIEQNREYQAIYLGVEPGANQSVVAAFRQAYDAQR